MKARLSILLICLLFVNKNARAQLAGCTDDKASNYNELPNINDGSCHKFRTSPNANNK